MSEWVCIYDALFMMHKLSSLQIYTTLVIEINVMWAWSLQAESELSTLSYWLQLRISFPFRGDYATDGI